MVLKVISIFILVLLLAVAVFGYVSRPAGRDHTWTSLLGLLAALLSVAWIWYFADRSLQRSIRRLAAGMKELEQENFSFRFDLSTRGRFATLAVSFNAMAAKLESTLTELRETRDYFEGIVENSADIIITVSPRGYVYTFNRGAENALGYTRAEVIGRSVAMLFPDVEERDKTAGQLKGAESVVNYETHFLTKGGDVRDVILTLSRLNDPDGSPIGTFGIAKDVTELNRMQKELLHAERFAAIGQALTGIQHAMKNMLNAMKGGAYMVTLGLTKDKRPLIEEGWKMVQEGMNSITNMSLSMLKYVREWKLELEQVDVSGMLKEMEAMFRPTAKDKGVHVRAELPDEPLSVTCDAKLVHSAVMDILSNALDACSEKPYEEAEVPEISLRAGIGPGGDEFVLSIRDNGCGMTEKTRANVFTPFFSTKKSWGTGLGLALTSRTIRLHGGDIKVESEVNVGTEFCIVLPIRGPEPSKET
jgi:PAS domain S-box-containing protein